jgi:exocyst complex component 7
VKSLHALGLNFLRNPAVDAQALGHRVEHWRWHLEFVVHRLLESEQQLCVKVFGKHKDFGAACFTEVASRAGVLDFLRFGRAAGDAKKDPIKLLLLLEVFDSLNKLRLDFIRLFGGKACPKIQSQTRDLLKLLVTSKIFMSYSIVVFLVYVMYHVCMTPDNVSWHLAFFIYEFAS